MAFFFFSGRSFTGGPLAIHQAASVMNELGGDASIIYLRGSKKADRSGAVKRRGQLIKIRNPLYKRRVDQRLKAAGVNSASQATIDDHFVVAESDPGLASYLISLGCKNVYLWWLSVDNFPLSSLHTLENRNTIRLCHNLCQSHYALDLVKKLGAGRVSMLSDFIEFETPDSPAPFVSRSFDIAYLPAKSQGAEALVQKLGENFNLVALRGMSRSQIEETLRSTKVFIDFGHHPGKDRVPREAALCGCIPLVRKTGAASYYADVPLPDELLVETSEFFEPEQIGSTVSAVLEDHSKFDEMLSNYKNTIINEKRIFEDELRELIALDV